MEHRKKKKKKKIEVHLLGDFITAQPGVLAATEEMVA